MLPAHLSLIASASASRGWPATMRASSIPEYPETPTIPTAETEALSLS